MSLGAYSRLLSNLRRLGVAQLIEPFEFMQTTTVFCSNVYMGKIDQILPPKGILMTIAPLRAIFVVLSTTSTSPCDRADYFLLPFFLIYISFFFLKITKGCHS